MHCMINDDKLEESKVEETWLERRKRKLGNKYEPWNIVENTRIGVVDFETYNFNHNKIVIVMLEWLEH